MDFECSPEVEAFRREVRRFLKEKMPADWKYWRYSFDHYSHDHEVGTFAKQMARELGAKGWLSLTWPEQYGGKNASVFFQLALMEELENRVCPGYDIFGIGMLAPIIIRFGNEEQKAQYLPRMARGELFWCEGLSEPEAGSDLASLRTQAIAQDNHYLVNGQKLWTSGAHQADWCFLLVRTDREQPKHRGLSVLLVDMKSPGITVRPLINMAGDHEFNEVFFDNVPVPRANLLGEKNKGWYIIMALLDYERSTAVPFYASAIRYLEELQDYVRRTKRLDPVTRQRLAQMVVECEAGRLLTYRAAWLQGKGVPFTSEAAMNKIFTLEMCQRVAALGMEIMGPYGILKEGSKWAPLDGRAPWFYLRSIGNTLEMGTSEIDRDVMATRGLGLPRG